jgi:hypothetical protein
MYGFNTSLAEDVERFRCLRAIPGAYVFVQEYRWLSKRYVQAFGRLHPNLVDTIFRYNHRDRKGRYIQTLAGTVIKKRISGGRDGTQGLDGSENAVF